MFIFRWTEKQARHLNELYIGIAVGLTLAMVIVVLYILRR